MSIVIKTELGPCLVIHKECLWRTCLQPGYHTIRASVGASGCGSHADMSQRVCVRWTDCGCPKELERRMVRLEEVHKGVPRFPHVVRQPGGVGTLKCVCCGRPWPRWMIYEWQNREGRRR